MKAIIIAMVSEIKIENLFVIKKETFSHHVLYYLKNDYVLIFSGIGKVNAANAITVLSEKFKNELEMVLNLGTVGTKQSHYHPLQTFFINHFQYLDVNVTAFNYEINQVPKEKKLFSFETNPTILKILEPLQEKTWV